MAYYITNDIVVDRSAERTLVDNGGDRYLVSNTVTHATERGGMKAGDTIVYAQSRSGDPLLIHDNQTEDERDAIASDLGIDAAELERLARAAWEG